MTTTDQNLADDILTIVGRTEDGESVSFVMSTLRGGHGIIGRRWKNLGNLNDFEATCERLGFSLRRAHDKKGNIRATYVTL